MRFNDNKLKFTSISLLMVLLGNIFKHNYLTFGSNQYFGDFLTVIGWLGVAYSISLSNGGLFNLNTLAFAGVSLILTSIFWLNNNHNNIVLLAGLYLIGYSIAGTQFPSTRGFFAYGSIIFYAINIYLKLHWNTLDSAIINNFLIFSYLFLIMGNSYQSGELIKL